MGEKKLIANNAKSSVAMGIGMGTSHSAMNGDSSIILHTSQIMQGGATSLHGGAEIIVNIAEHTDKPNDPNAIGKSHASKVLGKIAAPLAGWGVINDVGDMVIQSERGGLGGIKTSTGLSLLGNTLGVIAAGGALMATAPAWVTVAGLGSLGLGVASLYTSYQHGDLTLSDVKDIVVGTANQAYQNVSESFREFMGKVGDKFLETVLESDKAFKEFTEKVKEAFTNTESFTDGLSRFLEPVAEFARDIAGIKDDDGDYDDAISKIKKVFEKIGELFDNTKETLSKITEDVLDLPEYLINELGKWLSLNRNGKHYFYDPLVLDLDGDGIETLGHNKKLGVMFDLECVNDVVYGLIA